MSLHVQYSLVLGITALAFIALVAYLITPLAGKLPAPKPGEIPADATVLDETGSAEESAASDWWLDSGGRAYVGSSTIATLTGELSTLDPWRIYYFSHNPGDSDNGFRPQNIFRLVSRKTYGNVTQELYALIIRDNLSSSKNRNESNGIVLFSRYANQDNLYYAGLRVDGTAVIKKKYDGTYYTLAQAKIADGAADYDHNNKPSLLPKDRWIGLRSRTETLENGAVRISVSVDLANSGNWRHILTAEDQGDAYDGTPAIREGSVGIRTDFMDVVFRDYTVTAW